MNPNLLQALRDILLLEIDWHSGHAKRLDAWAKISFSSSLSKQLEIAADTCRQRADALREVLAATEPKAEADAS